MPRAESSSPVRCLNCGETLEGRYCPACGQSAATGPLRLREIAQDAFRHFSSLDSQALRTVVGLTRDPGRVCLDYVRGQRVRYVAPLRYFLTLIATAVLLNLLVGFNPESVARSGPLSTTQEAVRSAVAGFAARHLDLAIFAVLPLFAGILALLFRKAGFTYAEVGVLALFVLGQATLLGLVLTPLKGMAPLAVVALKFLLQICLFTWASRVFFGVSWVESLLKNVLATAVYFVLVTVSMLALSLPRILAALRAA